MIKAKFKLTMISLRHPKYRMRTFANPLGPPSKPHKPSDKTWTIKELSNLKDFSMYFAELHQTQQHSQGLCVINNFIRVLVIGLGV